MKSLPNCLSVKLCLCLNMVETDVTPLLRGLSTHMIYWNASLKVYLNVTIWKPVYSIIVGYVTGMTFNYLHVWKT